MNTGPTTGVLTFRDDFGSSYTFTLDFGGSGSVRATIEAPGGGASVWPGMPHLDLTLGAQPMSVAHPTVMVGGHWPSRRTVAPDDCECLGIAYFHTP